MQDTNSDNSDSLQMYISDIQHLTEEQLDISLIP